MALRLCDHWELVGHWFWSWDHRRFGIWVRDPMRPYCRRRGKSYRNSRRSALVLLVRGLSYPSYEIAHHEMRHIGRIKLTDQYLAESTIHRRLKNCSSCCCCCCSCCCCCFFASSCLRSLHQKEKNSLLFPGSHSL